MGRSGAFFKNGTVTEMVQEIDEAYWGHYKGTKAEAKVYARKVILTVPEAMMPKMEFDVHSFDKVTGQAVMTTGWYAQTFTADFSTIRSLNQGGEPVKMMEFGSHRMYMEEKYKDGEPPSLLIPLLVVLGVILLFLIVFNK